MKGEEDMAAKKAALLEKRLRREKETQERKLQQEQDQEQKREAARCVSPDNACILCINMSVQHEHYNKSCILGSSCRVKAEEEQQKKDEEKARRDYIKNEYMRRKQLKLMEDMDEVIKPRSGSLKKKPRPKSIHRDVMEPSTPPVRATGEQHTSCIHNSHTESQMLIPCLSHVCCMMQGCVLEASRCPVFL